MRFSETTLDQFFDHHESLKKNEKPTKKEEAPDTTFKELLKTGNIDYLLSVEYDGKNSCAAARFYDPKDHLIHFWCDNS